MISVCLCTSSQGTSHFYCVLVSHSSKTERISVTWSPIGQKQSILQRLMLLHMRVVWVNYTYRADVLRTPMHQVTQHVQGLFLLGSGGEDADKLASQ
eukprot:7997330-Pyramimonas_sp.AAC.1